MPGALHRRRHAAEAAIAVRRGRGDVIGVAGQAVADDLGIDLRAARLGVLIFLEHHDAGALAHHEAVAVLVVGPRGLGRRFVEAGRQRARGAEAGHRRCRQIGDSVPPATITSASPSAISRARVADRMRAGRAGRHHRMVRTLQAVLDRDIAGSEIDQAAGNEERRHLARAALLQEDRRVGDAGQAADAGADQGAGGALVLFALGMPVGIVERLLAPHTSRR